MKNSQVEHSSCKLRPDVFGSYFVFMGLEPMKISQFAFKKEFGKIMTENCIDHGILYGLVFSMKTLTPFTLGRFQKKSMELYIVKIYLSLSL